MGRAIKASLEEKLLRGQVRSLGFRRGLTPGCAARTGSGGRTPAPPDRCSDPAPAPRSPAGHFQPDQPAAPRGGGASAALGGAARAGSKGLTAAGEPSRPGSRCPPPGRHHNNGVTGTCRAGGPAALAERGPGAAPSAGRPSAVRHRHAAAGGGGREGEPEPGRRSLPPAASIRATFTSPAGAGATPQKEREKEGGRSALSSFPAGEGGCGVPPPRKGRDSPCPRREIRPLFPHPPREGTSSAQAAVPPSHPPARLPAAIRGIPFPPSLPAQVSESLGAPAAPCPPPPERGGVGGGVQDGHKDADTDTGLFLTRSSWRSR